MILRQKNEQEILQQDIARKCLIRETTKRLIHIHSSLPDEQVICDQIKQQTFTRAYVDNETYLEEEKQQKVAKARDSMPFGMNIRKAAYKASIGNLKPNNALIRYATMGPNTQRGKKKKKENSLDSLSENSSESDSVSLDSSENFTDADFDDLDPSKG